MEHLNDRRTYRSYLLALALGACIGAAAWHWALGPASVGITGVLQSDSASYQDSYLTNSIFISSPTAPNGRVYLRFGNNKTLNQAYDALGANAKLNGVMRPHKLDSGAIVTELRVRELEVTR